MGRRAGAAGRPGGLWSGRKPHRRASDGARSATQSRACPRHLLASACCPGLCPPPSWRSLGLEGNERLVQDYALPTLKAALKVRGREAARQGPASCQRAVKLGGCTARPHRCQRVALSLSTAAAPAVKLTGASGQQGRVRRCRASCSGGSGMPCQLRSCMQRSLQPARACSARARAWQLQPCDKCLAALPPLRPQALDSVWLREGPYVAGQAQPSIADLLLACEVEQLCLLDGATQASP